MQVYTSNKAAVSASVLAVALVWVVLCLGGAQAHRQNSYWLCPRVACPSVSSGCLHSEYIVFEYHYRNHGRLVQVRCESCPYCTDLPGGQTTRRSRRSVPAVQGQRATVSLFRLITDTQQCPEVACPEVQMPCSDVRMTNVILRGKHCHQCQACYDNLYDKEEVIDP